MMKSFFIFFIFISLAATCQNTDKGALKEENPCDPDMMCTMEFRVLNLTVVDEVGDPIILDKFYTEYEDFIFTAERNEYQIKEGLYPVVNDGDMNKLSFKGETAKFIGIKSGEKIVQHTLKVGKDCCHVLLMDGEEKVVVKE